jgi:putative FmdB family regulatory protein
MPTYTYVCTTPGCPACGREFEETRSVATRHEVVCRTCGKWAQLIITLPGKEIVKQEGGPIAERSKAQLERELSEQVQRNELPPHLGDAQAKLGGL